MIFAVLAAAAVVAVGVLLWRRQRVSAVRPARSVDPFTLSEPWRQAVSSVQSTERRYRQIVADTAEGPLRTRLDGIGDSVRRGVAECSSIATSGDDLDDTLRQLDVGALRRRLAATEDTAVRESLDRQVAAAERIREQRDETDQRLRQLTTRLGELVTQAAEIRAIGSDADLVGSAVDDVVTQLEGLRLAVRDVHSDDEPGSGQGQARPTP